MSNLGQHGDNWSLLGLELDGKTSAKRPGGWSIWAPSSLASRAETRQDAWLDGTDPICGPYTQSQGKRSGARESKKPKKVSGDQGKTATFFQAAVIQDLLNEAKAGKELAATLDQCVLYQIPIPKLVVSKEDSSNTALSRILDTANMPDISNGIIALTDLDSECGQRLAGVLQVLTTCHR